jgi:hypothetical protein
MNRTTRNSLIIVALLLLLGTVYAWWGYSNRRKVQQLLASMPRSQAGQRPDREAYRAINEEVKTLPVAYQQQFHAARRDQFMAGMQKRMTDFFKLSKEEQRKELDKRIAEEEKRSKEREQRRKEREAQAKASGNSGSNGSSSGGNGRSGNGGSQGGGPSGGGGGPGGWGGNRSLADRLDNTTPEFRATMAAYRQAMAQRRAELGLPPKPPRRQYL